MAKPKAGKSPPDPQGTNRAKRVGKGNPPEHTRFRPGQSGNPKGRPKGKVLTELIRDALDKPAKDGRPLWELVAQAIVLAAVRGDAAIVRELWSRLEGKLPDKLVTVVGEIDSDKQLRMVADPEIADAAATIDAYYARPPRDHDAGGFRP